MRHRTHTVLATVLLASTTLWLSFPTMAEAKYKRGYVVAESRFGNGTVSGPIRRTRVGLQVRTPGGNWLHCARSCAETLRVNTVDFWQNGQGAGQEGAIDNEDGLLAPWLNYRFNYE